MILHSMVIFWNSCYNTAEIDHIQILILHSKICVTLKKSLVPKIIKNIHLNFLHLGFFHFMFHISSVQETYEHRNKHGV